MLSRCRCRVKRVPMWWGMFLYLSLAHSCQWWADVHNWPADIEWPVGRQGGVCSSTCWYTGQCEDARWNTSPLVRWAIGPVQIMRPFVWSVPCSLAWLWALFSTFLGVCCTISSIVGVPVSLAASFQSVGSGSGYLYSTWLGGAVLCPVLGFFFK